MAAPLLKKGSTRTGAWSTTRAWLRNPAGNPPYLPCEILEAEVDGKMKVKDASGAERSVDEADLHPANLDQQPDNSLLFHLSEAALLANLLERDALRLPYTTTGEVLTSINPCTPLPELYSLETMREYVGKRPGSKPHLYTVAESAYRQLVKGGGCQAMLITGVSGAGKTEANKHILQYLCWRAEQRPSHVAGQRRLSRRMSESLLGAQLAELSQRVLVSSSLFEAFGNACTTNNPNSSRFGKFVRLLIEPSDGAVQGAVIDAYLLEKSRLAFQNPGERNFHVFYQLLTDTALCTTLGLVEPAAAAGGYLRDGAARDVDGVDDAEDWGRTRAALSMLGATDEEVTQLAAVLAGILRLGDVGFEPEPEADTAEGDQCEVAAGSAVAALAEVVRLWKLDGRVAERALTTRTMETGRGSTYEIGLSVESAARSRDGLAKALYEALFLHLVDTVNAQLEPDCHSDGPAAKQASLSWIGLLDAFGFELLQTNSFEQLLINGTNEQLQQLFLQRVLRSEQHLYETEAIQVRPLVFTDNSKTLDLIFGKPAGLMALLDEECRLLNGNDAKYASHAARALQAAGHEQSHVTSGGLRLQLKESVGTRQEATRAKIKQLFSTGQPHFTVAHFAGEVVYEVHDWLERNNDELHRDLRNLLSTSAHPLIAGLFPPLDMRAAKEMGSVVTPTVCQAFARDLEGLMLELRSCSLHFVRCIKPNDSLTPGAPDPGLVLDQLRFSGMLEAVALISSGYPGRIPFVELRERFAGKLPREVLKLGPGDFVRAVIAAVGIESTDYQVGRSKLFFRTGGADFLKQLLYADADEVSQLVGTKLHEYWARRKIEAAIIGARGRAHARLRRTERAALRERLRREAEEQDRLQAEARAVAAERIQLAMAHQPSALDMTELRLALDEGRRLRVDGEMLGEGEALYEEVALRRCEAEAALRAAMAPPVEMESLRTALEEAIDAGVLPDLLDAARGVLVQEEERAKLTAEARAALLAAERAAAIQLQAASRRHLTWRRYGRTRRAIVRLQAAVRGWAVRALMRDVLEDARTLREGNVFIKFAHANGRPHDKMVWCTEHMDLRWEDPLAPAGSVAKDLPLLQVSEVKSSLGYGLLKKLLEALKGYDGKTSGMTGLKPKCCFSVIASKRSLDLQAPSETAKEEFVSALRMMLAFRRTSSSLSTVAGRAPLLAAHEQRRLVREALNSRKAKAGPKHVPFFSFMQGGKRARTRAAASRLVPSHQ